MQTQPRLILPPPRTALGTLCALLLTLVIVLSSSSLRAADVTWTGGPDGTNTTWLNATNWDIVTVPTNTDNAIFDAAGPVNTVTILMSSVGGLQRVGSVTVSANNFANRTIRNNSTTTRGALELNGVGGTLLANYSGSSLTLLNAFGTSLPMEVRLATSGTIHVANAPTTAQIVISSSISETNGSQGFTKTGPGILYLQGTNNTFTGSITNVGDSWIKVNADATFGTGVAPVYLTGDFGGIISGSDRGSALSNPIVISGNVFIKNDGGTTGTTRTLPFSGAFSGSSGSLTLANLTPVENNTFLVRLQGSFNFSLPVTVGSGFDTANSFSVLQLYNSATNGTQTFSGVISGQGSVRRQGATSSPGGTAIFTGDNTYSGGTLVTYGTLLVNNTSGTGTGSGAVTVTNQGVLGGYGSAGSTLVSLGGTISPGLSVSNLNVSDLTFGEGGNYLFEVASATGTPGASWDVIRVGGGSGTWTDTASATNPVTIKVDSMGVAPSGWNSGVARDWIIVDGGTASGFDVSHFALDTTAFAGTIQGIFSLSVSGGDLHLVYTPAADIVINVAGGTQTQAAAGYPQLSGPFGLVKTGNGELVLNNSANDYAGSTKVYAGTASLAVDALNGSGALGSGSTAVLLGNTAGNSNATLNINTAGVTVARNITVQTGSSGTKTIGTSMGSGMGLFSGDITLQDTVTVTAVTGGETSLAGLISGTGGLIKSGAGMVTLSGLNS